MKKLPVLLLIISDCCRASMSPRKDNVNGSAITTFDIRMTSPNDEPVMNTAEVHTIEHLGATFLRNHKDWQDRVIYFGPMGCRTGFYLLLAGDYTSRNLYRL